MGLDLLIETIDFQRHPNWGDIRYSVHREIARSLTSETTETWHGPDFPWGDDRMLFRPKDFAAFRALADASSHPERWHHCADLLEADENYWIYLSV